VDKDILHKIIWEDASWPCGDDHVTKSRNRKLIRVTSSNDCLKHMCIDGSTENAGPDNGGPKKDERTENAGLKMKDQMSGVENVGPENAGPKHQDRKMEDQQPEADYEI